MAKFSVRLYVHGHIPRGLVWPQSKNQNVMIQPCLHHLLHLQRALDRHCPPPDLHPNLTDTCHSLPQHQPIDDPPSDLIETRQ